MDMQILLRELMTAGYTEARIADEVDVATSQATINRIKRGARKRVSFDLGMAIMDLHSRVVKKTSDVA